ncbi:hypothetical protein DM02DRAFT_671829 [Periconia macrospinosa]|uniref:Uncharacterized protein n=1 Tax=Periconia macrospinosa TaxID=97972 RepID=A0A2V1DR47_9PLEO|nr:hypothetical protein DM02DRAFT_671829 [Periconia macrospinosa]
MFAAVVALVGRHVLLSRPKVLAGWESPREHTMASGELLACLQPQALSPAHIGHYRRGLNLMLLVFGAPCSCGCHCQATEARPGNTLPGLLNPPVGPMEDGSHSEKDVLLSFELLVWSGPRGPGDRHR